MGMENLKDELAQGVAVADGPLRMLLAGSWMDERQRATAAEEVRKYLMATGVDEVLVLVVAHALAVKPGDRAPFDKLALKHLAQVLSDRKRANEEKISAATHLLIQP